MKPEIQLIQLYLWVCAVYDKHPPLKYQRWSKNPTEPLLTAQEVRTISLFGQLQERFKLKAIHRYIEQPWSAWFPHLPSDQAFNRRLNLLAAVWPVLRGELMAQMEMPRAAFETDQMLDALPMMLAVRGRATNAKVALDQADQAGASSTGHDDLYARQERERSESLSRRPKRVMVALRFRNAATNRVNLQLAGGENRHSAGIQNAARVRSSEGLRVHCYGKLTAAFYLLCFNP